MQAPLAIEAKVLFLEQAAPEAAAASVRGEAAQVGLLMVEGHKRSNDSLRVLPQQESDRWEREWAHNRTESSGPSSERHRDRPPEEVRGAHGTRRRTVFWCRLCMRSFTCAISYSSFVTCLRASSKSSFAGPPECGVLSAYILACVQRSRAACQALVPKTARARVAILACARALRSRSVSSSTARKRRMSAPLGCTSCT